VTLYGLIIMFAYPFLYLGTSVGSWLGHNDLAYAVWAGATLSSLIQPLNSVSANCFQEWVSSMCHILRWQMVSTQEDRN
jgi:uncharacterized membrane protein YadS